MSRVQDDAWMMPGAECWVQVGEELATTEQMFARGTISGMVQSQTHIQVQLGNSSTHTQVAKSSVSQTNSVKNTMTFSDMVTMNKLNCAEIISNLERRYKTNQIFTFIGPTLIVINPYKVIPELFNEEVLRKYQLNNEDRTPHTYAIASHSYSMLLKNNRKQAIVISGESGAGKTENAKIAMSFLTTLTASNQNAGSANGNRNKNSKQSSQTPIETRILQCNPILEAFGNAKTLRNDNSSRFGKFVAIHMRGGSSSNHGATPTISGASITNYLLEKSRVTAQIAGERNYHIFYYLLFSGNAGLSNALELSSSNRYAYLTNEIDRAQIRGFEEACKEVIDAFTTMGVDSTEQLRIFQILSAVLLLGNINFDASTLSDTQPCRIDRASSGVWSKISGLLQIDSDAFENALVCVTRKIGSSIIKSPKKLDEVLAARDAVARHLYERLFSWIVIRLNSNLSEESSQGNAEIAGGSSSSEMLGIGLLDIFGFEVFAVNSFEQFCINYTNEKLQQLYIAYVFKAEEQALIEEDLKEHLTSISYTDNSGLIDVFDKHPLGIFQLIDESSGLQSSTDEKLFDSIVKTHRASTTYILIEQKQLQKKAFTIIHTAKPVEYSIAGFRDKNKAEIAQEFSVLVAESDHPILPSVYFGKAKKRTSKSEGLEWVKESEASKREAKYIGSKFRAQMKELMQELSSSDCHFIRCIKPNEAKSSELFLQGYVLIQIKYLGVLQAIQARQQGFPYRKELKDVIRDFGGILQKYRVAEGSFKGVDEEKKAVRGIVGDLIAKRGMAIKLSEVMLVGKTRMFAKESFGKILDSILMEWYQHRAMLATKIVLQIRRFRFRRDLNQHLKVISQTINCFRKVQAMYRMYKQRKRYLRMLAVNRVLKKMGKKGAFLSWKEYQIRNMKEGEDRTAGGVGFGESTRGGMTTLNQNSWDQHQTVEKMNTSIVDYSSAGNFNTFKAANNEKNMLEIKENALGLKDDSEEVEEKARKEELEEVQRKNRLLVESLSMKVKVNSKIEVFLNRSFGGEKKPEKRTKSHDCLVDFSTSNQAVIQKIQASTFAIMCSSVLRQRNHQKDQMQLVEYSSVEIKRPLTRLPEFHEATALKAFHYILQQGSYGGDKPHFEDNHRIIAQKLLRLCLLQEDQEVTDEIFLQSVKQIRKNTKNSIQKYFKLICLLSSTITLSPRVGYGVMNYFLEMSETYQTQKQEIYCESCKYILLRIGNNLVQNIQNESNANSFFKRQSTPLLEEYLAIEALESIDQAIYIFEDKVKYYRIESYTKVCNLIGIIGLDLETLSNETAQNFYGLVEYVTINGKTQTEILDFSTNILDWRANRYRDRIRHIQSSQNNNFSYKLRYQTVIVNVGTFVAVDIDQVLMMFITTVSEYINGLFFFDFESISAIGDTNLNEFTCLVELAAAIILSESQEFSPNSLNLVKCVPSNRLFFTPESVWKTEILKQVEKLQKAKVNSQRKARTYFLARMQLFSGRYFLTQKNFCFYQKRIILESQSEAKKEVIVLTKLGHIYIMASGITAPLDMISMRDIQKFFISSTKQNQLFVYTEKIIYCFFSKNALNLYYNIQFYITSLHQSISSVPTSQDLSSNRQYETESPLQVSNAPKGHVEPELTDRSNELYEKLI